MMMRVRKSGRLPSHKPSALVIATECLSVDINTLHIHPHTHCIWEWEKRERKRESKILFLFNNIIHKNTNAYLKKALICFSRLRLIVLFIYVY